MQLFLTILVAVFVFTASQYILKMIIEPIQEQRQNIGRTASFLLRNLNVITGRGHRDADLAAEAKTLAAELWSTTYSIFLYRHLQRVPIFGLPKDAQILEASHCLNWLSSQLDPNSAEIKNEEKCSTTVDEIGTALGIPTQYQERIRPNNDKPGA